MALWGETGRGKGRGGGEGGGEEGEREGMEGRRRWRERQRKGEGAEEKGRGNCNVVTSDLPVCNGHDINCRIVHTGAAAKHD